ncbi:Gfo/Idh/MocA family oxidoreductase [Actinomyces succiniciruminis]|uniref:Gfo/Idh/MocA family oxidoreductase n=1 Tax=Actinomyces succiniciruminis TaxID=1522002 RepID=UPI003CC7C4C9
MAAWSPPAADAPPTWSTTAPPASPTRPHGGGDTDLLHSAYVGEFKAFVEAIRGGDPAIPTGDDGVKALQIARAAIVSIQQSRTVRIEELTR